ncbi:hypothetical protein BDQ12DRAFT_703859 [Crucibulum laeve]|uniref:LIM zinc-binding domain-containing protein n=1 Tax=Crucibulum laeve TaxID=68775 RepID=A0A5C3M9A9_9AGAR|nr:hypothetical protein BDQ12DRAFT_703859 [Crucibulum laeve]
MGFCRICGEIVIGTRCKCGGTAVAPAVPWNQTDPKERAQDRWSNTYVSRERSTSPVRSISEGATSTPLVETSQSTSPTKRFPRPTPAFSGSSSTPGLDSRISAHIASAVLHMARPPSPLKSSTTLPNPTSDILPSLVPHDTTLSKVYGSVLQPKETLITHSCGLCSSPFLPDATIYPDPAELSANDPRFLCRACYITNGGSKGICPSCSKDVLTLTSEGGFIHAGGNYWHKRCFTCEGCFKYIGNVPMVDLLGRPSCAECFDNCLKRDSKKSHNANANSPRVEKGSNLGGMALNTNGVSTPETSPVINELEKRLGITRSREGSPALEDLIQHLSMITDRPSRGRRNSRPETSANSSPSYNRFSSPCTKAGEPQSKTNTPTRCLSNSISPIRPHTSGSTAPTGSAIEEMKQRFIRGLSSSPASPPTRTHSSISNHYISSPVSQTFMSPMSVSISPASLGSPTIPSTPDLVSDFSDSMTQSSFSGPDSPYQGSDPFQENDMFKAFARVHGTRHTKGEFMTPIDDILVEETDSQLVTPTRTPKSKEQTNSLSMTKPQMNNNLFSTDSFEHSCAKCSGKLFNARGAGSYITLPRGEEGTTLRYHTECLKCSICRQVFRNTENGHTTFLNASGGPCHVECAPPERVLLRKSASSTSLKYDITSPVATKAVKSPSLNSESSNPSRCLQAAPSSTLTFPRFGSRTICPGCHKSVSPMEHGVVPGPQGTRWHALCLVCGGKKEVTSGASWILARRQERNKREPGCGKRLDSAAKCDGEGGVWCRECLQLLLGTIGSPQMSPTRRSPANLLMNLEGKIPVQSTGTTTIARQFTGIGSGDVNLLRQLTGGSRSPTRSVSPTKHLALGGGRPRPKSVAAMRSSKSIDEGRGMFLVRQMTGSTNGWEGR